MPIVETEAVIIRGWDYGESDRIISCYTLDYGKINIFVKGIKNPKNNLKGCFEPLTYINLSFLQKGHLKLYKSITADMIDPFIRLKSDFRRLMYSFYILTLINESTKEFDQNVAIFDLMLTSLRLINNRVDVESLIRVFEIKLVDILGYAPRLDSCVICTVDMEKSDMVFSLDKGGLLCKRCGTMRKRASFPISRGGIKFFRQGLNLGLDKLSNLRITNSLNKELKPILTSYLTFHLEKEIKPFQMFTNKCQ
ncbi:MAG: DNA repair protein RecO [bacterium]